LWIAVNHWIIYANLTTHVCARRRYVGGKYYKIMNMKNFTTLTGFSLYTLTSNLIEKSQFSK